ncbi:hypothetical protein Drorol1_Dr00021526 [Drosera rotundifolia]
MVLCRFSVQEYTKFRGMPIQEAAIKLAENGKIGALNLLFRRHPYSLAPYVLEVLSAIPETVPVQTYNQLLPGRFPPKASIRTQDWVESEKVVNYIGGLPEDGDTGILIRTEPIVKQLRGFAWPPIESILEWYKDRARCIDIFTGQLENCLYLVAEGCIYSSSAIDKWSTMASLLWTLQQFEGSDHFQRLELQIRSAEFHIEAGRLLALYQKFNAEADAITTLTVKLPNLGVHILPVEYKQIKDPMEVIKMAITSQAALYLSVDELIEVARLLGLDSQEDISAVQESIAREAAVAGDLQLAYDLCIVLAKKGHGPIWDLCAAIARGPEVEGMDIISRKQLLGFSLSHCDDESIRELLHVWKNLDIQSQSELLMALSGTSPPNFTVEGSSFISLPGHSGQQLLPHKDFSAMANGVAESDFEAHVNKMKSKFAEVAKNLPFANGTSWDLLRDYGKVLSFAALNLPWTQTMIAILSWLARFGFSPKDDLIAALAKSVMESPVAHDDDVTGSAFLLNLVDAIHGVEVIEEQLKTREDYQEISSIMNVGMTYSFLHSSEIETEDPGQRRNLLIKKFRESISPDEIEKLDKSQSTFWIGWKEELQAQKQVAAQGCWRN